MKITMKNGAFLPGGTVCRMRPVARGAAGERGVGIGSVTLKSSGEAGDTYTLNLTDGTSYDITAPRGRRGEKGDTGAGLRLLGTYPTAAALTAAAPEGAAGDAYAVGSGDDYIIYVWSGSGWTGAGPIRGEKGDAGVPGAAGSPGAAATINGVNVLTILAGNNITLDQTGGTLTIAAGGVQTGEMTAFLGRTAALAAADTGYTALKARGEKLMDGASFDAVTDWSTQLVNGAIAWRYE